MMIVRMVKVVVKAMVYEKEKVRTMNKVQSKIMIKLNVNDT